MWEISVLNSDVKRNLELSDVWQQSVKIIVKEVGVEHVKFIGTTENRAMPRRSESTNYPIFPMAWHCSIEY
jgi:hypothetical protein